MKIFIAIFFLLFTLALEAKAQIFDYDLWAKDLQTMISLNSNFDESVKGSDQNQNQVRDDVENYIKEKYAHDEFQKIMFLEAARKIQQILTLPKDTPQKLHIELDTELLQIYTCRDFILYKYADSDIDKEMEDKLEFKEKILNTSKRLEVYLYHKKIIPFKYAVPSDRELKKQKNLCEQLYNKIKSENKQNKKISTR